MNPHDLTYTTLKKYINDGNLSSAITTNNYPLMPIIKFISFDKNGHLQLLLAGKCPNCDAKHIRNTCNARYCSEVIDPIIKNKFNLYSYVTPLFTHASDFELQVNRCGGSINYTINPEEKLPFHELEHQMLDFHPDIDTHVKMMSGKDNNAIPYSPNDIVSFNDIKKKYNFMFLMMKDSKLAIKDGQIITGDESIRQNREKLIPGFSLEICDGMTLIKTNGTKPYNIKNFVEITL